MVKLGHCGLPEELEAYYFGRGRQRGGSRYDPPEDLDGGGSTEQEQTFPN